MKGGHLCFIQVTRLCRQIMDKLDMLQRWGNKQSIQFFFIENFLKKATFRSKIGQDGTDNMLEEVGQDFIQCYCTY